MQRVCLKYVICLKDFQAVFIFQFKYQNVDIECLKLRLRVLILCCKVGKCLHFFDEGMIVFVHMDLKTSWSKYKVPSTHTDYLNYSVQEDNSQHE